MRRESGQEETVSNPEESITGEVIEFVMNHAYCADSTRGYYRDDFRRFIVELRRRNAGVETAAFAEAVRIPVETIEDWIRTTQE